VPRAQDEDRVALLARAAENLGREAGDDARAVAAVDAVQRPAGDDAERRADGGVAAGVGDAD
jgi:hypothetical protein